SARRSRCPTQRVSCARTSPPSPRRGAAADRRRAGPHRGGDRRPASAARYSAAWRPGRPNRRRPPTDASCATPRGSSDDMATEITSDRLRELAEARRTDGKVLSLYINLDPREFATPPARASAVNAVLDEAE